MMWSIGLLFVFYFFILIHFFFFFFKQKTAYEISACLVGSEMCIRDSPPTQWRCEHGLIPTLDDGSPHDRPASKNVRRTSHRDRADAGYGIDARSRRLQGLEQLKLGGRMRAGAEQLDLTVVGSDEHTDGPRRERLSAAPDKRCQHAYD